MNIIEKEKNVQIEDLQDFNLEQTLECGQCFRFNKIDEQYYVIVARGKMLRIKQEEINNHVNLILYDTTIEDVNNVWIDYFDLKRDYGAIKKFLLEKDNKLEEAIKTKNGIRILNQEYFETLISFIISQNKQIPHIKQIVESVSCKYGKKIGEYEGKDYYSFPTIDEISNATEEEFKELKTGFRAGYLVDAIKNTVNGNITEEMLIGMNIEEVNTKLQTIRGVGEKVANCVMLFGLGRREAFPVDVWIKRIMEEIYFKKETKKEIIQKFALEHFGEYGGYAQQYLFYYARDGRKDTKNTQILQKSEKTRAKKSKKEQI